MELTNWTSASGKTKYWGILFADGYRMQVPSRKQALSHIQYLKDKQNDFEARPNQLEKRDRSEELSADSNNSSATVQSVDQFPEGSGISEEREKHYANTRERLLARSGQIAERCQQRNQRAEQYKREAEQHGKRAEEHGVQAEQYGREAEQHKREAEEHEKRAEEHGKRAEQYKREAEQHRQDAIAIRNLRLELRARFPILNTNAGGYDQISRGFNDEEGDNESDRCDLGRTSEDVTTIDI